MTDRKHTTQDRKRAKAAEAAAAKAAEAAAAKAAEAAEPLAAAEAAMEPEPAEAPDGDDAVAVVARERDEYLDHLRRLKAEFDNYRKRVQRDNEQLRLRAAETVVESLLPVMDNLSRALEAGDRHEEGQLLAGLGLVADQLRGTLAGHGLEEIEVEPGTSFDPEYHEAIMAQSSPDHPEGTVTQVLERGYLLHGKLLRPAKVIVAS
jgi:molecular chaperone GrpE